MPKVLTRETASVGPSGAPVPYQHSQAATADAFGAAEGRAIGGMGEAIGQFGNVMQKHAMLIQARANESYAKDLFLGADVEMGDAQVRYNSLEGVNKVNAYPGYVKELETIRDKWKKQAPNVEVAHHFDNDFSRRMAYNIVNGAGGAATANKQYNQQNNAAMVKNAQSDTAANADDDVRFQDNLRLTEKNAYSAAVESGDGPDEIKLKIRTATSDLWKVRLKSIAQTDPFRAEKLLNENKTNADGTPRIDGKVVLEAQEHINNQKVTVGTKTDGDAIEKGLPMPGLPGKTSDLGYSKEQMASFRGGANAAKANEFWGNPNSPDFASNHLTAISTTGGKNVTVNKVAAPYFQGFISDLEARGYKINDIGGYNYRGNTSNPSVLSQHGYGNAIDINPNKNPFDRTGRNQNDLPADVGELAAKWGLSWGGDWSSVKDPMHFEFTGVEAKTKLAGETPTDDSAPKHPGPLTKESGSGWLADAYTYADHVAEIRAPNDPRYKESLIKDINTRYNNVKRVVTLEDRQNVATITQAIGIGDNRLTSLDPILNDPQLYAVWDKLDPGKKKIFANQIEQNAKGGLPYTEERDANFKYVMGLQTQDPEKFLSIVPGSLDGTNKMRDALFSAQQNYKKNLVHNDKVNAAVTLSHQMIPKEDYPTAEAYTQFVGALSLKLAEYKEVHKEFPNDAEQRKIIAELNRNVVTAKRDFWFDKTEPAYAIPSDWNGPDPANPGKIKSYSKKEWIEEFKKRNKGREPEPRELFDVLQKARAYEKRVTTPVAEDE